MSDERRQALAREILERITAIGELRAMSERLQALGHMSFAFGLRDAIRFERSRIDRLAHELHIPTLTLTVDVAAFARAQLGLPIDAPLTTTALRRAHRASKAHAEPPTEYVDAFAVLSKQQNAPPHTPSPAPLPVQSPPWKRIQTPASPATPGSSAA